MARKTTPKPEDDRAANPPAEAGAQEAASAAPNPEIAAGSAAGGATAAAKTSPQVAAGDLTKPSGVVLRITGPKKGRRRAGRQFGPAPVLILLDDLTEAEIEALRDDPALKIEVT